MNVLIFHPVKEQREMVGFCLESQLGINVLHADNFQKVVDLFLEEGSIDLVIAAEQPELEKFYKFVLSTNAEMPIIIVSEEEGEGPQPFPDLKIIKVFRHGEVPDQLMALIREQFSEQINSAGQSQDTSEYCRINTGLLVRVIPLKSDIFIRLSSVKYVKLFKMGANFTQEDCEKYLIKRKVEYLYMKKKDSTEFVEKFRDEISDMIDKAVPGDPTLMTAVSENQEAIVDLANRLGFTPEVQDLAKKNVKLALKAIGKSAKLSKVLAVSKLKGTNYISSHSVLLANVSCAIAAHMDWPSNTTFQKLVMAAFFHDLMLQDPELAKISTKRELDLAKSSLTTEQLNSVKNHPSKCAEILKTINEVPSDVDIIVAQHHESPDGYGFPKGSPASQIAPLSAVMIVAHDVVNAMEKEGEKFDINIFVKKQESVYNAGAFRKVWRALNAKEVGGPAAAAAAAATSASPAGGTAAASAATPTVSPSGASLGSASGNSGVSGPAVAVKPASDSVESSSDGKPSKEGALSTSRAQVASSSKSPKIKKPDQGGQQGSAPAA